jgi:hypothetical protein
MSYGLNVYLGGMIVFLWGALLLVYFITGIDAFLVLFFLLAIFILPMLWHLFITLIGESRINRVKKWAKRQ